MNGTALSYDLRYSRTDITQNSWNSTTRVNQAPPPRAGGTSQWCLVSGLVPNTTYFFAIRAKDHNNNTAPISNVVSGTTLRIIPDLFIGPTDLSFSPERPTEGDTVTVTATFHAMNLTHLIDLTVQMLVDDNASDSRTVQFNASIGSVDFGWTAVKGNHSIGIRLDPGDLIEETERSNDLAERNISVAAIPPSPLPDLYIGPSDITFSKENPVEGEMVNITATAHSVNLARKLSFEVELTVDGIPAEDRSAELNGTGASLGFVWNASRGWHNITFLIDPGGLVAESDELDNSASRTIFVGAPDLFITPSDILIPVKSPLEGTVLFVTATVHAVNLTRAVAVRVDLQVDSFATDNAILPLTGPSGVARFNWTAVAGVHDLTLIVDSTNAILEEFEENNRATAQVLVRPRPASPVLDLFIWPSDISFSRPRPIEGDNLTITAMVHAANLTQNLDIWMELKIDGQLVSDLSIGLDAYSSGQAVQFNWKATKGNHTVTMAVRHADGAADADPSNDNASKSLTVAARPVPPPGGTGSSILYAGMAGAILLAAAAVLLLASKRRQRKI
jgi:subtilase family serine protease